MRKKTIYALLGLLLCAMPLRAQMARLYTSRSGLANTQIHDIYQDGKGFVWIATENGLSRFDGMNFTNFRSDRDKAPSVAANHVKTTIEDSDGTLWVASSAGLQIFDPNLNLFRHVALPMGEGSDAPRHVTDLLEMRIKGKDLLFASTSGYGIFPIDIHSRELDTELRSFIESSVNSAFISMIFADSAGRLWAAAENGGLTVLDLKRQTVVSDVWTREMEENAGSVVVNAMLECESKILLGTLNHGLLVYDKATGKIRRSLSKEAQSCKAMSLLRNNMFPSEGGESVLLGLENDGMRLFDTESERISYVQLPYVRYQTDTWKVHSLLEDKQGNLWVGAFQTGVLVVPKSVYGFEYILPEAGPKTWDASVCVTSICGDEDSGELWVGTDGSGLFRIGADGSTRRFHAGNSGLTNNSVMSLAMDRKGTLWVATYLGGLFRYRPEEGFRHFDANEGESLQKTVSLTYSREQDRLYIDTHGSGLWIIDPGSGEILPSPVGDYNKWISTLYLNRSGHLLIGSFKGTLCYFPETGRLTTPDLNEEMSSHITCVRETDDGSLWIGTSSGLARIGRDSVSCRIYTEADGLPSNAIMDLREGDDGMLWVSTQYGLSRMNPATEEFKSFYQHDGLQENEFLANSSYEADDGKLYFGGIKGITAFYPHDVDRYSHEVPPLHFSDLSVMNEKREYDPQLGDANVLDRNITEATLLTLPFRENIFTIEFSVLEYTNPYRIKYAYMLDGFDNGWNISRPESRSATYTNLPAGKYKLKVKAYYDGEPENYSYREMGIRILPPWYGSWWAIMVYFIIAALCVWMSVKWQQKQVAIRKGEEESALKEMKLKMFANITHEIRTPLSLVIGPLNDLREGEKEPKLKKLYNLMYRNSLRALRLVNQLLDIRKIDNGQMRMHFLETDVIYFIRDIMQSFDNLALSKNIRFTLDSGTEPLMLWIDQGNFDKIIFNILSNAFKKTPDGGNISVSISAPRSNDGVLGQDIAEYVEFVIENSGSSIEEKYLERIFERYFQANPSDSQQGSGLGLNLAKMLVELHHGDIRAYNTREGIAFSIRIPYGCSHLSEEEKAVPNRFDDLYSTAEERQASREDITGAPANPDAKEDKDLKSRRHIVLVDDDGEMRAYLKLELQSLYNVDSFSNAQEAWKCISTTLPDAVVTDLLMEGMDGAELCAKIKKNPGTNHIPVLILTSSEQSIGRCIECGADRFFTKPTALDILKGAIANAIATRDTIRNKFSNVIDYGYSELGMPDRKNKLIDDTIRVIKQNLDNSDFSVEDLSRGVGLSRAHLNRKLKEHLNITPNNLIKSIRLKQAAFLLIHNKVNIAEVAYKVGFSSSSYFSNAFHDYFGMPPKDFVAKYSNCEDDETLKKLFGM